MRYHVPLIGQLTPMSCWAASIAMILSWAQRASVSPDSVRQRIGYDAQYVQSGITMQDKTPFDSVGMVAEPAQNYTVEGFMQLLQHYGPLWVRRGFRQNVTGNIRGGFHAVVVTGFDPHPDPRRAMVHVNDPWARGMTTFSLPNAGSRHQYNYHDFVRNALEVPEMVRQVISRAQTAQTGVATDFQPDAFYIVHLRQRPHTD
ncbi:C39 family peptidase [Roseomonas sp. OT10]|uniref:papain-like cysteine protease family protein n=1 Tax=Roseomonas cutis TaxID=2897332 RepID=UPI001E57134B|nr:papain-like cysteine protease family protein [Roseomonas sp. OT10]UFN47377.1 C39 family peptidase [Roseomonas sp. OT10]